MKLKQLQTMLNEHDYTLVADRHGDIYTSYAKGVAPVINPMKEDEFFFKDAIVVDKVVGKAAAMLLIKSQIQHLHTHIISKHALSILKQYHISYSYDECVDYIINRQRDGMCPMEQTVLLIDDVHQAFEALCLKQEKLKEEN